MEINVLLCVKKGRSLYITKLKKVLTQKIYTYKAALLIQS